VSGLYEHDNEPPGFIGFSVGTYEHDNEPLGFIGFGVGTS
jgi:hypothetical protein